MSAPLKIGRDINLLQETGTMPTFGIQQLGGEPEEVEIVPDSDGEYDSDGEEGEEVENGQATINVDVNDGEEDGEDGEEDGGEDEDEDDGDADDTELNDDELDVGDVGDEDDEADNPELDDDDDLDDELDDDLDDVEIDDDLDDVGDEDEEGESKKKNTKRTKKANIVEEPDIDYGIDSDDDDIEFEKFESDTREEYLLNFHPESAAVNFDEVRTLCTVVRDEDGDIVDPFHTTIPYLTKYEKARILGLRAKQLNNNIKPTVDVAEYIIDSYRIAEIELEKKSIPFIIRRPLPNGQSEYWRVYDLLQIY